MSILRTKSAKLFLERYGLRSTYRIPAPTVDPTLSLIHSVPELDSRSEAADAHFHEPPLAGYGKTAEPWPYPEDCS